MLSFPLAPERGARLLVAAARQAGTLRGLGDVPGHPFHGNQWTAGSGAAADKAATTKTFSDWQSGDATVYDDMRNPKTALGKETTKMLESFPIHDGVTYRGLGLESKDIGKLVSAKGVTMTLHSSTSKDEGVAKGFMEIARESMIGKPVLLELHGRTRDISEHLHSDYKATKETVAMAGVRYRFERLTHEKDYTRVTLREIR